MPYLHDGALEIDNNLVENAIKAVALGKRTTSLQNLHKAAQNVAMTYWLFAICKKHSINPYQWLQDLLKVIQDYKVSKLTQPLLQNFMQNKK